MTILISCTAAFFLVYLGAAQASGFRRWKENSIEQGLLGVREDCTSSQCLTMFPDKRGGELEEETGDKPWPVSRVLASYHVTGKPWQISCPCETQYDIIDLGLENYPRYLATARCASKPCHNKFNQCRLMRYKVHILRPRDASIGNDASEEQAYVEQIVLPESLRMKWQMKPINIAVACVAGETKKN